MLVERAGASTSAALGGEALALAWVALERERASLAARAVEVATALAERVVLDRVALDPALARRALEEALKALRGDAVLVRVHPVDEAECRDAIAALAPTATVVVDREVERGGVVVEGRVGVVDARPSLRLAALVARARGR